MGKPIVFDIVDSWAQPEDGMKYTDANQARKLFSRTWQEINVDGYIFPTKHMQDDLGALIFLFFLQNIFLFTFLFCMGGVL